MADIKIPDIFGSMVFNDKAMKENLSEEVFLKLKNIIREEKPLPAEIAQEVATGMKNWAVDKGATHFTHWFQPMTGITAEKHDSFINPCGDGQVVLDFSGKELIHSEPDASSFPSGGLRATFEARGYAAWDPTSYAFIKEKTLCIPSIFCSYEGHILDKKTPLIRSNNVISKQALRIVKLFDQNTSATSVIATVGAEQEFFLIDREMYNSRKDLVLCGRTLFGEDPLKSQEMEDHYFGSINPRVTAFMKDLDLELWKLGVYAKTEHNEAAPSQHELAPIYCDTNMASDHNQLTMEMMKKVAIKHNLACLLHEKPFAGINGSGKHNNWSISTDNGVNLLEPGDTPRKNMQFLTFLAAIIKAIDEHQDLVRLASATAGNDLRLGGDEAPPSIISIFLGSELSEIIDSIINKEDYIEKENGVLDSGIKFLPEFKRDTTDRNRTSPVAFTGNKFEFRMLGSKMSIACPNTIINTIVADVLCEIADILENAEDFEKALSHLLRKIFRQHKRIIFDGNNYSKQWVEEAAHRGLLNLPTTPDALPYYIEKNNVELFERNGVYTEKELQSRYEILMQNYIDNIHLEAITMVDMVNKEFYPAINKYIKELAESVLAKTSISKTIKVGMERSILEKISEHSENLYEKTSVLSNVLDKSPVEDIKSRAVYYKNDVLSAMKSVREEVDKLEKLTAKEYWPFPSYSDLLYKII